MTARYISPTRTAPDEVFPEFAPRDDMNNPLYLHIPAHMASLARHLGSHGTTLVLGEVPVGWLPAGDRRLVLIPDLIVAFNVDPAAIIRANGYSIDIIGKPPDFALEVASPTTGVRDYTFKRTRYAEFGIPEYWRFDPSGGEHHDAALAGDRLGVDGYSPIEIETIGEDVFSGHSDVLGLDIRWEYGQLRFYDPVEGCYLMTFDEEADGRQAAEERAGREFEARQAAEDEVRRLRDELARLRGES